MKTGSSPENSNGLSESVDRPQLAVAQPDHYKSLLDTIALIDKVTETMGEDRSGDMGGGGGMVRRSGKGDDSFVSERALALQNLPDAPEMRKQLQKYIHSEVKSLRKQVRRSIFRAAKPGSAHQMNQVYARMRRLNGLLAELMEASYEVLKRVFVRVFVDKQSVM